LGVAAAGHAPPVVHLDLDLPPDLVWADDSEPGIRRRRAGRGFSYAYADGRKVAAETVERIRALAIPPAWTNVWICRDPAGHLQATGRDARGRKQYRYHPRFRAHRDQTKFDRLYDFGRALPAVRKQLAIDLDAPGVPRDKVVATVIRLLEATLVRVGNEEYARANKSYGLTTLRDRHAQFTSDGLRLVFKGKHGISNRVTVQDKRLRRVVKQCQDLPGQVLFQYLTDDGAPCPVTSTDVNEYLRDTSGFDVTAKDFRTWMGTLLAAVAFADLPAPRSDGDARQATNRVLEVVSGHLGNTVAVCRASYVHPTVLDEFAAGTFAERWHDAPARGSRLLLAEEKKLLHLLRPARRRQVTRPSARAA
jgi:DNA topoisomerase I